MTYYDRVFSKITTTRTQHLCKEAKEVAHGQAAIEFDIYRNINGMTDAELVKRIEEFTLNAQATPATKYDLIEQQWQMRLAFMASVFAIKNKLAIIAAFVIGCTFTAAIFTAWHSSQCSPIPQSKNL